MMPGGEPAKSPSKYIYVARNPKDTAVSYYHHKLSLTHYGFNGSWDYFFEQYLIGRVSHGSWFDHVLEWWKHRGECIMYEYDMFKMLYPQAM